jgi:4-alpha-glucanotransferase
VKLKRSAGVLLHATALPGPYGIGDLGDSAYHFIDWMQKAKQSWWQVLPLGPAGDGDSPFSSCSSWAGTPLIISLDKLVEAGDLTKSDLKGLKDSSSNRVNFNKVRKTRAALLARGAERFFDRSRRSQTKLERFCRKERNWLEDWVIFAALNKCYKGRPWSRWPKDLLERRPEALRAARKQLSVEIQTERYVQYRFFEQWAKLKKYANRAGIKIIGDMPIYCGLDSADVWANRKYFKMKKNGQPAGIAGVPGDMEKPTGQLWGNPTYDWKVHKKEKFCWWISRIEGILNFADVVRIDHFRGFASYWEVPSGARTAKNGKWRPGPRIDFFNAVKRRLPNMPVIIEDLGARAPGVPELREAVKLPGMRVVLFGFNGNPHNIHLIHNFEPDCVVYTGLHDHNTITGWYKSLTPKVKKRVNAYFGTKGTAVHRDIIKKLYSSVSKVAILPVQDILGLDRRARFNVPGTPRGNWVWKLRSGQLKSQHASWLADQAALYGRYSNHH